MKNIIAYCGIICNECPVFRATKNNDYNEKEKLANEYSSDKYKVNIDDINCTGCHKESEVVFKFCKECEIRLCGIDNELENCGQCNSYPCSKLDKPFENSTKNKEVLDKIKEEAT